MTTNHIQVAETETAKDPWKPKDYCALAHAAIAMLHEYAGRFYAGEIISADEISREAHQLGAFASQLENTHSALLADNARLREALTPFAAGSLDVSETAVILGYPKTKEALTFARSALTQGVTKQ